MDYIKVKKAVEKGGSLRAAARLLGTQLSTIQYWMARNGYVIVKRATIKRKGRQNTKS